MRSVSRCFPLQELHHARHTTGKGLLQFLSCNSPFIFLDHFLTSRIRGFPFSSEILASSPKRLAVMYT